MSVCTNRERFWLHHLRACEVFWQTSIDFAKAHGLKFKSLYAARKALAEKGVLNSRYPGFSVRTGATKGSSTHR